MILYFTGTGNSKYNAEYLADKLGDEVVSMNQYIKAEAAGEFVSEKPYVFVAPVYLATIPEIVRNFIAKSSFAGSKLAYFVSTCASVPSAVANDARKLCETGDKFTYMGSAYVRMPQNYIAFFSMTPKEEQEERFLAADQRVTEIATVISANEVLQDKPSAKFEYGIIRAVEKMYNNGFTKTRKFIATDNCIGCSICVKNCPVNAIKMVGNKPVWVKKNCIHCMACINRCPKQAIEYGKGTKDKERYFCKNEWTNR